MNIIQSMIHEKLGEVRIIVSEDGNPMNTKFCALDVARALGYYQNNLRTIIHRHCRYVTICDVPHPQNPDKIIEMNFIPLSDVFRLISRSNKPEAIEFQDWVNNEVLPALYHFGTYTVQDHIDHLEFSNPIYTPTEDDFENDIVNKEKQYGYYEKEDIEIPPYLVRMFNKEYKEMSFEDKRLLYGVYNIIQPLFQNQQVMYEQQQIVNNRLNNIESEVKEIKQMIIPAVISK